MKILQVIPYFVPAWDYGGPVRVCYELSKELVSRGHEVTVYTTDALDVKNRIEKQEEIIDGIRVKRFKNLSNAFAYRHNIFLSPNMLLPMKELGNFDVIHMHEYRTLQNALIHHYAKKYGTPYVLQAHGSLPRIVAKQRLKKLYDNLWGYRLLKDASKVIALTETEAVQCKSMGVKEDNIEIVPNGIAPSEFDNLPRKGEFKKKYGLNDSQKIILYLGRIHETKGLDLLANAFAGLSKDFNEAKLVIVGPDDGYLSALKALVKELKIEGKVLFTGPLYGEEKLRAYVDADVFVTPSFYGFPVTFVEACACGTPIVTTQRWCNLGWIQNQVGYEVAYDGNCLEDALARLLNDADLAEQFRERGRKLVREQFTWSRITEQLEHIYLSAEALR